MKTKSHRLLLIMVALLLALLLMASRPAENPARAPDGEARNGPPAPLYQGSDHGSPAPAQDILKRRAGGMLAAPGACIRPVFIGHRLECPDGKYVAHPIWPEDGPR